MKKIDPNKFIKFDSNESRDSYIQLIMWQILEGPIEKLKKQASKMHNWLNPKKTKKISLFRYIASRVAKVLGIIALTAFGILILYIIKDIFLYVLTYAAIGASIILIIYGLLILFGTAINKKLV